VPAYAVNEQELIERFLSDPAEDTFACLYRALSPCVFRFFIGRSCERSVAEELMQDVMLAVYRQSRQLRDPELFRPWMFKIALNAWRKHLRQIDRRVVTTDFDTASEHVAAPAPDPLVRSYFRQWMEWLDPDERELITLRHVDGMEYHEIAAVLGLPTGTVQWRLFHTRRKLAARFGGRPPA
jgi:RNA polymerase sigma-70 factor (ECF subfamily)